MTRPGGGIPDNKPTGNDKLVLASPVHDRSGRETVVRIGQRSIHRGGQFLMSLEKTATRHSMLPSSLG
jgi:hypothetical protein